MDQQPHVSRPATLADSDPELLDLLEDHSHGPADGLTIAVYLPAGTPQRVQETLYNDITTKLAKLDRGNVQVAWQPGNPLHLPG